MNLSQANIRRLSVALTMGALVALGLLLYTPIFGDYPRVVITDRIDELNWGRFASRFWVYGRFVVGDDGKIAVWRDSFDWLDVTIGNLRGLAGLLSPGLNRRMPAD